MKNYPFVTAEDYPKLRVLAFDPGITTGIAYRPEKDKYVTCVSKDPAEVWGFINPETVDLVIYEDFVAQLISRYGLATVRVVGGIQSRCDQHGIKILLHRPQMRKAFIDIARSWLIEHTGSKGTGRHEIDALAHILTWEWMQEHPRG